MKAVLFVLMLGMLCGVAGADTHTVCSSGCDYTTIQAAVTAAAEYDTIYVYNGTYTESLSISTAHLTIQGEGRDVVTVQPTAYFNNVFEISGDYVNISGVYVTGATAAYGIYMRGGGTGCNISNNKASVNGYGIRLASVWGNEVKDNQIIGNTNGGMLMATTSDNLISGNTITGNAREGITMSTFCVRNTFIGNDITGNAWSGIALSACDDNNILNNNISGNTQYGVSIANCCNVTVHNNTVIGNEWTGIYLSASSGNNITNNTANSNKNSGIRVYSSSSDNNVTNNTVRLNTNDGILVTDYANNNSIVQNDCSDNGNTGISFWTRCNDSIVDGNNCSHINGGVGSGLCMYNHCRGTMIRNNTCRYNGAGIHFEHSSNNTIIANDVTHNNQWGIRIYYSSDNNTLVDNNVDGFFDYAFTDSLRNVIRNPADATNHIRVFGSSDVLIENNDSAVFTDDSAAVAKAYPNGNFSLYRSGAETFDITQQNVSVLPTEVFIITVTTCTEPLKRWNESAASDMYAFYTVGAGDANTTYVVSVYADVNGSRMQTFRIKSNTTGFIKYNSTGYGYDRWTEVMPATEPPGTLVVFAVLGAVLAGGGWAIRRWVRKS